MASKTLTTAIDTWANQDAPGINHGTGRRLYLNGQASHKRYGYMFFGKPYPIGSLIVSAHLTLRLAAAWSGTNIITVSRITQPWKESKLTWTNAPAITATHAATATVTGGAKNQVVTIDVTAMLQDVAAGGAWYGFRVEINTTGNQYLWASDAPNDYGPQMDVTWTRLPDAVTDLHPADGGVVGTTTPTFTWTFRDIDGTSDQASSQVQVDDATDFATPVWDSGMIANANWQQLCGATLTDGSTYYWRVRVTDSNGNVSAWSDTMSLKVTSKGTLTLTSPGSTVEETTPPIAWTFTGRTQLAYRVILTDNLAIRTGGRSHIAVIQPTVVWDTGRVTSTDTSVHVPRGLIAATDAGAYTVEVRVWDTTAGRQSTPGVPNYQTVSKTFTFGPSGVPAKVLTLTAAGDDPGVQLTWTRAAMPDYFAVKVDGDIPGGVDANGNTWDRLDPTDYFVSGTTYRLTWLNAEPNVAHTYEVVAVVNSAGVMTMSSANPTASYTTAPRGAWLVDMDTGDRVQIMMKNEPSDWGIGEEATIYYPLGRRDPVRIVTSIRGYEGSLDGRLLANSDGANTTADTWRARLEAMKGNAVGGDAIRLIMAGFNIPVGLAEVHIAPAADEGYIVSFAYAQTGEFPFPIRSGA